MTKGVCLLKESIWPIPAILILNRNSNGRSFSTFLTKCKQNLISICFLEDIQLKEKEKVIYWVRECFMTMVVTLTEDPSILNFAGFWKSCILDLIY